MAALDQTPAPNHISVAARPVRSDDREDDEWLSSPTRRVVADRRGIMALLPDTDRLPSKPETNCLNRFTKMLVSQLTWTHKD
jgi:hypothetical protein